MDASTADFLKGVANVVLGWTLGVVSAGFTQWRKDRKRARATKTAIARELRETAHRLLALIYKLEERHGGLNRNLLEWMRPQIERYEGPNPKGGLLAGVSGLLSRTDAELAQFAAHLQKTTPPQFVPREDAPYTTVAVAQLHEHDPEYAVRALDVLSHIRMLNESRENELYYSRLTFAPGLTTENHEKAMWNASQAEQQMARRARIIVDKITELEEMFPQDA